MTRRPHPGLMTWAQGVASDFLAATCDCYSDAFPAESTRRAAAYAALEIAKGYHRNHPPAVVGRAMLHGFCPCHALMDDGAEDCPVRSMLDRELARADRLLAAAFHARDLDLAHEAAIDDERTGG